MQARFNLISEAIDLCLILLKLGRFNLVLECLNILNLIHVCPAFFPLYSQANKFLGSTGHLPSCSLRMDCCLQTIAIDAVLETF